MDYLDEQIIEKLKAIREEANKRCKAPKFFSLSKFICFIISGLNPVVILTRVDQVCDETAKDITKVYNSSSIKDTVKQHKLMH